MKRPSFQFYPSDWLSNPGLRRCTWAERGIWLETICLMHAQPEYGIIRWPLVTVAHVVGCKESDLRALEKIGVLRGTDDHFDEPFVFVPRSGRKEGDPVTLIAPQDGPIWFSSRMVRDEYKARVNTRNGALSRAPPLSPSLSPSVGEGSLSHSPSHSPSRAQARAPRPSSSSSSSASPRDTPVAPVGGNDGRFEKFWKAYPSKVGKAAARKSFDKCKPDDAQLGVMLAAIETQKQSDRWRKDGGQFIPNPATWLNQGRWDDEVLNGATVDTYRGKTL